MAKAIIKNIRVSADASKYIISVEYPEFDGQAGQNEMLIFETTVAEYQAWTPPLGVTKTVENFILYKYIKPGYDSLELVHNTFHPLIGKEFWW